MIDKTELKKLYGRVSQSEMARRFGVSREAVRKSLVAAGLHDRWRTARGLRRVESTMKRWGRTGPGAALARFLADAKARGYSIDVGRNKEDARLNGIRVVMHRPSSSHGGGFQVRCRPADALHVIQLPRGSRTVVLPSQVEHVLWVEAARDVPRAAETCWDDLARDIRFQG